MMRVNRPRYAKEVVIQSAWGCEIACEMERAADDERNECSSLDNQRCTDQCLRQHELPI